MWEYNYDYLQHGIRGFKYIKREKGKTGKWVYTYPDDIKKLNANSSRQKNREANISNKPKIPEVNIPGLTKKLLATSKEVHPKITTERMTSLKKELLNTYLKSKDTTKPERERAQINQAFGLILNRVEKQYGKDAAEEMKNFCESFEKISKIEPEKRDLYIAMTNEDSIGKEDPFDNIFSISDTYSYIKDFFGSDRFSTTHFPLMKRTVKTTYFRSDPDAMKDFKDDEIVALYFLDQLRKGGYSVDEISVSQYIQNRGWVNENSVLSDSKVTRISDLKKVKDNSSKRAADVIDDDKDMEYVNHRNLDAMALSPYDKYPGEASLGYTSNCAYCSLAYDLRQRGFDVEASSVNFNTHNTSSVISSWYEDIVTHENAKVTGIHSNSYDTIKQKLLSDTKDVLGHETNNARGHLIVGWTGGGGHDVIYEITNGNIMIRDCQLNKSFTLSEYCKDHAAYIYDSVFIRTDDKKVRDSALVGVRNRRDD